MSIEVGSKVSGKISGITNFGAFVDLGDKKPDSYTSAKFPTVSSRIFMMF